MKEFFTTLYGKAIAVLTIIALLLSIGIEGISIYTGWQEAIIKRTQAWEAEIKMRIGSMPVPSVEDSKERFEHLCADPNMKKKHPALCANKD